MSKSNQTKVYATLCIIILAVIVTAFRRAKDETIIWRFDNLEKIGNSHPHLLSTPEVAIVDRKKAIVFDGVDDAMVMDEIPIAGWKAFTIEVLIKPDASGPIAPRFMHFEDEALNRGTMEMRIVHGQWYMDCFLKNGDPSKPHERLTLIDSTLLHPCDEWYWVAMTYDGSNMKSYINGQLELQGTVEMNAFGKGKLSAGARLNKVNWFKGAISEMRFHSSALAATALQQIR